VKMAIRDRLELWLEPKRWLDDLEWVYKTSFLRFVIRFGAIRIGLLGGVLFFPFKALLLGKSAISAHELRFAPLALILFIVGGALCATTIWLITYWHFKKRSHA